MILSHLRHSEKASKLLLDPFPLKTAFPWFHCHSSKSNESLPKVTKKATKNVIKCFSDFRALIQSFSLRKLFLAPKKVYRLQHHWIPKKGIPNQFKLDAFFWSNTFSYEHISLNHNHRARQNPFTIYVVVQITAREKLTIPK